MAGVASQRQNLVFLKGYSEAMSQSLYSSGDLFLMPCSHFETVDLEAKSNSRVRQ